MVLVAGSPRSACGQGRFGGVLPWHVEGCLPFAGSSQGLHTPGVFQCLSLQGHQSGWIRAPDLISRYSLTYGFGGVGGALFITGTEVQWSHVNPSQMTSLSLTDVLIIFLNDMFGHKLKIYSMIEWKKKRFPYGLQ